MKLIVESGSTKTDWILMDGDEEHRYRSAGINPTSMPDSEQIVKSLRQIPFKSVKQLYYYGAGTSRMQARGRLHEVFKSVCNVDCDMVIETDIYAACLALSAAKASIVNILGTGSNTVLFDGNKISETLPSLGYLFGEPGSGYDIGHELLTRYLNSQLEQDDRIRFEYTYEERLNNILEEIYSDQRPNFVIAAFAEFLSIASTMLREEILGQKFNDLLTMRIDKISNSLDYKLNFVGSIAWHYKTYLQEVCESRGYIIDRIVKSPLEGLISYHRN